MFSARTLQAFDVQDVFALCLVPGAWCLVPGVWCLVSGFWFLVSGFWFLVSGCWFLVSGFWFLKVMKEIMVKSRETGFYIQTQLWVLPKS